MADIQAILFDMDGVLIDAREWHYEALNKALRLFGMEIPRTDHLTTFDGLPTMRKLQILSDMRGLPKGLHGLINRVKQHHTMEFAYANCHPAFPQRFALARLREEGYTLAVCSNAVRRSVEAMMDLASLAPFLDLMLSNEDVSKPKPDPEIYLTAMNRLKVAPEKCLIVEDNEYGVLAAKAAGAHVLTVKGVDEVNYENIVRFLRGVSP